MIPRLMIYFSAVLLTAFSLMTPSAPDRHAEGCQWIGPVILSKEGLSLQVRMLYLNGTPFEMGYQHGCALKDDIRHAITRAVNHCAGASPTGTNSCSVRANGLREVLPSAFLQEIEGIARGANVSETDILVLNLLAPEIEGAGTIFAAWGEATLNDEVILGRVGDRGSGEDRLWIERRPAGGRTTILLTSPGGLGGWSGLSEHGMSGICVSVMAADQSTVGVPIHIAMRLVLEESATPEEASIRLKGMKHNGGALVVLADDQSDVAGLELSANLLRQMVPEVSTYASAGLFRDPDMQAMQLAVLPATSLERSQARGDALERTLRSNAGWIGVEKSLGVLEALADAYSGEVLLLTPLSGRLWYGDFRLEGQHLLTFNPWETLEVIRKDES